MEHIEIINKLISGYESNLIHIAWQEIKNEINKLKIENEALKIALKNVNICERCKRALATTKYSGMKVCEHCCKMLDDEFDREMS